MRFLRSFLLLVLAVPLFADVAGNVQYIPLEKFPHPRAGAQAIPAQPVPVPTPAPTPTPTPATCPCSDFTNITNWSGATPPDNYELTSTNIDALAALCTSGGGTPFGTCPATYSVSVFCIGGTYDGLTMGYWEDVIGQPVCTVTAHEAYPPNGVTTTGTAATTHPSAEFDACVTEITSASIYPGGCPQP